MKGFFYWNGGRSTLHVMGEKVFQLKNESSYSKGVLSNTKKKKKRWNVFMCRQSIQHIILRWANITSLLPNGRPTHARLVLAYRLSLTPT
jgi:hypothetical protein